MDENAQEMRFMLSESEAKRFLDAEAWELAALSYHQLIAFAQLTTRKEYESRKRVVISGDAVSVNGRFALIGVFFKRICVELTLLRDDGQRWLNVPCVYFERYASGKLLYYGCASSGKGNTTNS
ncbi:MAG: hypothetical protein AMXMBFR16_13580 [Candidatus Uhrbacteria bacterium]